MIYLITLVSLCSFASDYLEVKEQILIPKCVECHNSGYAAAGIDLSSYEGVLKTVIPYESDNSVLVHAVTRGDGLKMPLMGQPLSRREIRTIKNWIDLGAYED